MPCCCAVGCSNRDENGFRTFLFPRSAARRAVWKAAVSRKNWSPGKHGRLCEVLTQNKYNIYLYRGINVFIWMQLVWLYVGSIPTADLYFKCWCKEGRLSAGPAIRPMQALCNSIIKTLGRINGSKWLGFDVWSVWCPCNWQ